MRNLRLFIKLSRPIFLLGPALAFALGAGIAHYLGHPINWTAYWIGQALVTFIQLASQYLNEYYDAPVDQFNPNRTFLTGGSGAVGPGLLPRRVALIAALTSLALAASTTVLLMWLVQPAGIVFLLLALGFVGGLFYTLPPLRLEATGYGELIASVLSAVLVPALAFTLQVGDLHRLVAMVTFPAFAAHLAMMLAFELPDYSTDEKFEKNTVMVRMGWEMGMTLHNILILITFVLLLIASILGFPLFATLSAMGSLPIGLFQFWQMRAVANGKPVNWTALMLGGVAFYMVMIYLLTLAFWIN